MGIRILWNNSKKNEKLLVSIEMKNNKLLVSIEMKNSKQLVSIQTPVNKIENGELINICYAYGNQTHMEQIQEK